MESIELIRDNLIKSRERTLARIEEMRDHGHVAPTANGGGGTLWILGHLAYIEGLVIRAFMQGEPNPLHDWESFFDGVDAKLDSYEAPTFDDVLAQCRAMREATLDLIDTLTEADLDRASAASPEGHEATFGTYRLCLQFVADHWYMHRGQLAAARRSAAIDRMWF